MALLTSRDTGPRPSGVDCAWQEPGEVSSTSRDTGPRSSGVDCAWQEPREVTDLDIDPERSWIRLLDKDELLTQSSSSDGHGIGYGLWISNSELYKTHLLTTRHVLGGKCYPAFWAKPEYQTNRQERMGIRIGSRLETRLRWISSKFDRAPIGTGSIGADD